MHLGIHTSTPSLLRIHIQTHTTFIQDVIYSQTFINQTQFITDSMAATRSLISCFLGSNLVRIFNSMQTHCSWSSKLLNNSSFSSITHPQSTEASSSSLYSRFETKPKFSVPRLRWFSRLLKYAMPDGNYPTNHCLNNGRLGSVRRENLVVNWEQQVLGLLIWIQEKWWCCLCNFLR